MIIKNYGRHWEREAVNWGAGGRGNKGHLRGYERPKAKPVDFRDQIGIYVLHDRDLKPVYVGQAGNGNATLFERLKQHEHDHLWNRWLHFSWFGFRAVNSSSNKLSEHDKISKIFRESGSSLLNQVEGILLAAIEPMLNKQGSRWNGAVEYHQDIEEHLEAPSLHYLATKLEQIEAKLEKLRR